MMHTLGPWTVQPSDNGIDTLHDSEGRHFANLRSVRSDETKMAADRALIAAAPAMLAALQDAVSDLEAFRRKFHPSDWPEKPVVHTLVLNNARAAIAAATGKEG